MKRINPSDLHEIRSDDSEDRKFIVEISLKLRRRTSRTDETVPSLLGMVIDQ